jgi:imidazolonepropionase-like amidohydrolase
MAPALEVGLSHELGSIEVGKRGDLLVLEDEGTIGPILCGGYRFR